MLRRASHIDHRRPALICLSHLRWNFVFQRPQHLMTRCARDRRVYFVEEPERVSGSPAGVRIDRSGPVTVVVPQIPAASTVEDETIALRQLIDDLIAAEGLSSYLLWYYTPMALAFTDHLRLRAIVYDCMDELSAFAHAPADLRRRESQLMEVADLVLTGGHALYEAKRHRHSNIHPLPSSVDAAHFARAREPQPDPADQAAIPHPRIGYFGVIDERMDLDLLAGVAAARPDWHLIMIGPVVKIDPATLPQADNIHYLGGKSYPELPSYIAGWDVAMLPFARNDATRFISPTKTPEYLAAGKPVVSTSIRDVVRPYRQEGLVRIADDPAAFVDACQQAMSEPAEPRRQRADAFLRGTSWDGAWNTIDSLIEATIRQFVTPDQHSRADARTAI